MEAGADKTESKLAAGKHNFLKKFDQNFPAAVVIYLIENFRVRKFTFKLRRRRILTRASRDHHLRAAQQ